MSHLPLKPLLALFISAFLAFSCSSDEKGQDDKDGHSDPSLLSDGKGEEEGDSSEAPENDTEGLDASQEDASNDDSQLEDSTDPEESGEPGDADSQEGDDALNNDSSDNAWGDSSDTEGGSEDNGDSEDSRDTDSPLPLDCDFMLDFDPVFYEAAFFDDLDLDGSISMIAQDEQYFITVILGEFDPGKAESPNGRPIPGYKGIITESDPDYWGCQNCIIIDSLDGPSYFALEGIVQVTAINLAEETGSFHLHHVYAKEIENQAQEGESSDYFFSDPGRILCLESLLIESSE